MAMWTFSPYFNLVDGDRREAFDVRFVYFCIQLADVQIGIKLVIDANVMRFYLRFFLFRHCFQILFHHLYILFYLLLLFIFLLSFSLFYFLCRCSELVSRAFQLLLRMLGRKFRSFACFFILCIVMIVGFLVVEGTDFLPWLFDRCELIQFFLEVGQFVLSDDVEDIATVGTTCFGQQIWGSMVLSFENIIFVVARVRGRGVLGAREITFCFY